MDLTEALSSSILIAPELILALTGVMIVALDPFIKGDLKKEFYWLTLLGIVGAFYLNMDRFDGTETAFSGALSLDAFSAYFNVIFLLGAFFAITLSKNFITHMRLKQGEYYALILFATSGMMILGSAKEFMSLFLGFEIMSISVYVLSGFNRRSVRSIEAGIKYLILGGFSSAILLYGIALVYGASGSIHLDQIANSFNSANPLYICGAALILVGFIFKIGAFPFHQWVPDVYEGAPVTVTAFMSVCIKAAAFAILLRVMFVGFLYMDADWTSVLWAVSLTTMIVGNLTALVQKSVKRMLAYSSVAHAGYALVGVVAAYHDKELGLGGTLYYLWAYTFMNIGAFGVLAYLSRDGKECETFEDIKGLWGRNPLLALALGVFMFSLAGIPPTIGFFAKYRVFLAGIASGYHLLVVIGIITSVISAYYYIRVIVYAYMREEEDIERPKVCNLSSAFALTVLTLCTLLLGLFPLHIWDLAVKAAGSLLTNF